MHITVPNGCCGSKMIQYHSVRLASAREILFFQQIMTCWFASKHRHLKGMPSYTEEFRGVQGKRNATTYATPSACVIIAGRLTLFFIHGNDRTSERNFRKGKYLKKEKAETSKNLPNKRII